MPPPGRLPIGLIAPRINTRLLEILPALRTQFDLQAIYLDSEDAGAASARLARSRKIAVCRDLDDLAQDTSIAAVFVASRLADRAAHALRMLASGKHILLDMPPAPDRQSVREVVEAALGEGLAALPFALPLYDLAVREADRLLRGGVAGSPIELRVESAFSLQAAEGEDPVDWGETMVVHALPALHLATRWLGPPWSVSADLDLTGRPGASDNMANMIVQHAQGVSVLRFYASQRSPWRQHWTVVGTDGHLDLIQQPASAKPLEPNFTLAGSPPLGQTPSGAQRPGPSAHSPLSAHVALFEDFRKTVQGTERPQVELREFLPAHSVLDAAYISSRDHVKVQISEG